MFVGELSLLISGECHAELVEAGDITLELVHIHQEDRDRNTPFLKGAQKQLSDVLRSSNGILRLLSSALIAQLSRFTHHGGGTSVEGHRRENRRIKATAMSSAGR